MNLTLASIANRQVSSLSLLDEPYCFQPLSQIFQENLPGDWPIEKLDLSTRSRNSLFRSSIKNLSELGKLSPKEVSDLRNTGEKSIEEILDCYISKLSMDYVERNVVFFNNEYDQDSLTFSLEFHIWKVLEIIQLLERREISFRKNALASEKNRINEMADAWGISRQRCYQIIDALQDKIASELSIQYLANEITSEFKVQTTSEATQCYSFLNLGKIDRTASVSIFEVLLYSKRVSLFKDTLLFSGQYWRDSEEETIINLREIAESKSEVISPEALAILRNPTKSAMRATGQIDYSQMLQRAHDWLNNV